MSLKEFKDLDAKQLAEREAELRKQLFELRTQSVTEKVKDVSQLGKLRQDIARIATLRSQRELTKS